MGGDLITPQFERTHMYVLLTEILVDKAENSLAGQSPSTPDTYPMYPIDVCFAEKNLRIKPLQNNATIGEIIHKSASRKLIEAIAEFCR